MGAAGLTRIGAGSIGLDLATLLFTLGAAGVTAVLVAVLPAFQASARPPADTLKSAGGTGTARGHHGFGVRAVLVAAQIALALVLLTGAGLMVKSAGRLHGTGIGVSADRLLTARIDLPRAAYAPEAGTAFFINLAERVRALPGVESVGLGYCPPVSGGCNSTSLWFPPTGALTDSRNPLVGVHWITPEQLPTLGIRVLRGRGFTDRDRTGQPRVVLVNEAAARTHWPNADPIGKRVAVGQGGFHVGAEVIGVVSDVRYTALETAATPDVYVPLLQSYQSRMRLFVRSRVEPAALATAIRDQVRALDPNLPLVEVKTMGERVSDAMWRTRVAAWLLSAFAGLALLLTAIGVFGVMAQTVIQRTPEIGIRLALGAQRRDVLSLVLGRAALVTGAGLTAGVAAAFLLTRLIGSLLHGVEATDPATFVTVVGVLGLVSMAACYIPARRATRVDAVVALRSDQA
jgi:predicted permease